MPDEFGKMSICNAMLVGSNGETFSWSDVKDVTSAIDDAAETAKTHISFANNLEYTCKIETGPGFRKMLDRLQFGWKNRGPIRKKLWWRLLKKYKFGPVYF